MLNVYYAYNTAMIVGCENVLLYNSGFQTVRRGSQRRRGLLSRKPRPQ